MGKTKEKRKGLGKRVPLIVLLLVIVALGIVVFRYFTTVHAADADVLNYFGKNATDGIEVSYIDEGVFIDSAASDKAVIYYPGCKVEYTAYVPFCYELAKQGYDVFIVKVKLNFALFDKAAGQKIMDKYNYGSWILMGHSMGGIAISDFAAEKGNEVSGLVLLGAHGTADLTNTDIVTLVLYGSEDTVVQRKKVEKGRSFLAKEGNYHEVEIPGGNHANWANYGTQAMDSEPKITKEQQFKLGIDEIVKYFGN